jgi:hypothetical protein
MVLGARWRQATVVDARQLGAGWWRRVSSQDPRPLQPLSSGGARIANWGGRLLSCRDVLCRNARSRARSRRPQHVRSTAFEILGDRVPDQLRHRYSQSLRRSGPCRLLCCGDGSCDTMVAVSFWMTTLSHGLVNSSPLRAANETSHRSITDHPRSHFQVPMSSLLSPRSRIMAGGRNHLSVGRAGHSRAPARRTRRSRAAHHRDDAGRLRSGPERSEHV